MKWRLEIEIEKTDDEPPKYIVTMLPKNVPLMQDTEQVRVFNSVRDFTDFLSQSSAEHAW